MILTAKLEAWFLAGSLIFGAGMGAGWILWSPERTRPVKQETPAPAIVQSDGSVELKRDPSAKIPVPKLPKGAKVERQVEVVVQPQAPAAVPALPAASGSDASAPAEPARPPCPPVTVDLSVVRLADQTHRVIVTSPDGKILDGVDIPAEVGPPPPKVLRRAAGLVYGTTAYGDTAKGAFYDHDFSFLRTGAELTRNTYPNLNRQGWELRAKLGIRF